MIAGIEIINVEAGTFPHGFVLNREYCFFHPGKEAAICGSTTPMMPRLCLVLVLIALLFSVACGSGSGGGGSTGPFSNASLNGQYVYQINGTDFTLNANGAPYRESGVFSANGAQGITGGVDDFVEGGGGVSTNPLTGSYTINGDGTGSIVLNIAGGTLTFAVTMVSNSKVYLIEADGGVNASGLAEKQDPTAIAAVPSGTFIFRTHILNAALVPTATVGTMTIASSAVSSGNEDGSITLGATSTPLNLTGGAFTAPDSNGRGQFNLNNSTPATTGFFTTSSTPIISASSIATWALPAWAQRKNRRQGLRSPAAMRLARGATPRPTTLDSAA